MDRISQVSTSFQIPSIVSYTDGVVKACGAEAVQDFYEHEENVAYWFKVVIWLTISHPCFSIAPSDLC
jgi:hypothetical protein